MTSRLSSWMCVCRLLSNVDRKWHQPTGALCPKSLSSTWILGSFQGRQTLARMGLQLHTELLHAAALHAVFHQNLTSQPM